jgi:hypothetical protein
MFAIRFGEEVKARTLDMLRGMEGARLKRMYELTARLHPNEAPRHVEGHRTSSGMQKAGRSREAVYRDWLAARLMPAANLVAERTTMVAYERCRLARAVILVSAARDLLQEALADIPCRAIHRPRAQARARRLFEAQLRGKDGFPGLFSNALPEEGGIA